MSESSRFDFEKTTSEQFEKKFETLKKAIGNFDLAQLDRAAKVLSNQREYLLTLVREGKIKDELILKREEVRKRLNEKFRRALTGDAHVRVRDHLRIKASEPLFVRLIDKIAFTFGVLTIVATEMVLLLKPEHFWKWYSLVVTTLLTVRYPYYKAKKVAVFYD